MEGPSPTWLKGPAEKGRCRPRDGRLQVWGEGNSGASERGWEKSRLRHFATSLT